MDQREGRAPYEMPYELLGELYEIIREELELKPGQEPILGVRAGLDEHGNFHGGSPKIRNS